MKLLKSNNFEFTFGKLKCLSGSSIITFDFPGISIGEMTIPTPILDYPVPGDKLIFSAFTFSFLVDHDLANYKLIMNWMKKDIASLDRERDVVFTKYSDIFEDATLTILTNNKNPIAHIDFKYCFPLTLDGFSFATGSSDTVTSSVTFEYSYYDIRST